MRDNAYFVAALAAMCLGACKAETAVPPNVGKGHARTCKDVREGSPPAGGKQRQALWKGSLDDADPTKPGLLSWTFDATFDVAENRIYPKEICLKLDDPSNRIGAQTSMVSSVTSDGTMRVLVTFVVTGEASPKTQPPVGWVSWLVEIHGDSTANVTFFPSQLSLGSVGNLSAQFRSPLGIEVADQVDASDHVQRIH